MDTCFRFSVLKPVPQIDECLTSSNKKLVDTSASGANTILHLPIDGAGGQSNIEPRQRDSLPFQAAPDLPVRETNVDLD